VGARVLVVDDEPALLQLIEKYLKRLGYDVESHSTAHAALRSFSAAPESWRLVIADLGMPDLPGEELLRRMFELNPRLRCLLCSGTPFDLSVLPPPMRSRTAFLLKPFLPSMLSDAIKHLL
jgi:DNA-binding NtrC family response regulator